MCPFTYLLTCSRGNLTNKFTQIRISPLACNPGNMCPTNSRKTSREILHAKRSILNKINREENVLKNFPKGGWGALKKSNFFQNTPLLKTKMTLSKKKDKFAKQNEDELSATKLPCLKSKTTCLRKEDDLALKGKQSFPKIKTFLRSWSLTNCYSPT